MILTQVQQLKHQVLDMLRSNGQVSHPLPELLQKHCIAACLPSSTWKLSALKCLILCIPGSNWFYFKKGHSRRTKSHQTRTFMAQNSRVWNTCIRKNRDWFRTANMLQKSSKSIHTGHFPWFLRKCSSWSIRWRNPVCSLCFNRLEDQASRYKSFLVDAKAHKKHPWRYELEASSHLRCVALCPKLDENPHCTGDLYPWYVCSENAWLKKLLLQMFSRCPLLLEVGSPLCLFLPEPHFVWSTARFCSYWAFIYIYTYN